MMLVYRIFTLYRRLVQLSGFVALQPVKNDRRVNPPR
jgi:hypothetical protein